MPLDAQLVAVSPAPQLDFVPGYIRYHDSTFLQDHQVTLGLTCLAFLGATAIPGDLRKCESLNHSPRQQISERQTKHRGPHLQTAQEHSYHHRVSVRQRMSLNLLQVQ